MRGGRKRKRSRFGGVADEGGGVEEGGLVSFFRSPALEFIVSALWPIRGRESGGRQKEKAPRTGATGKAMVGQVAGQQARDWRSADRGRREGASGARATGRSCSCSWNVQQRRQGEKWKLNRGRRAAKRQSRSGRGRRLEILPARRPGLVLDGMTPHNREKISARGVAKLQ